jgi:hypothetical protein
MTLTDIRSAEILRNELQALQDHCATMETTLELHHSTSVLTMSLQLHVYDISTKHSISQPVISQGSHILWFQLSMLLQWLQSGLYIKIILKENIKTFKLI